MAKAEAGFRTSNAIEDLHGFVWITYLSSLLSPTRYFVILTVPIHSL